MDIGLEQRKRSTGQLPWPDYVNRVEPSAAGVAAGDDEKNLKRRKRSLYVTIGNDPGNIGNSCSSQQEGHHGATRAKRGLRILKAVVVLARAATGH